MGGATVTRKRGETSPRFWAPTPRKGEMVGNAMAQRGAWGTKARGGLIVIVRRKGPLGYRSQKGKKKKKKRKRGSIVRLT